MRRGVLLIFAALAACRPAEDAPSEAADEPDAAPSAEVPEVPPSPAGGLDAVEIEGEWRLAGVDERVLDQPFGVAVSVGGGTIRADSGCLAWGWRYTLENGAFEAVPQSRTRVSARPGSETAEICANGPTADERAIEAAMSRVERAERRPDASLHLSGGGSSLTLFTQ